MYYILNKYDAFCISYEIFKFISLKIDIYVISTFFCKSSNFMNREKYYGQLFHGDNYHLKIGRQ